MNSNFASSTTLLLIYLAANLNLVKIGANSVPAVVKPSSESTIVVHAGRSVRLDCPPQITDAGSSQWFFNGAAGDPIDAANNSRYKIQPATATTTSLTIENTVGSDSGLYTCVIRQQDEDSNGVINETIKLIVRDVPSPVYDVSVHCDNDSLSATIKFQYVESCPDEPAKEFWLQYADTTMSDQNEDQPNNPSSFVWETYAVATSHLRNDTGAIRMPLYPYGNFAFRVIARNEVGYSAVNAGDQFCKTAAARPSRNPSNARVRGETPRDVTISWDPLPRREWNGPELKYVIRYKPCRESDDAFIEAVLANPLQDRLVAPTNAPFECIEASVGARNALGDAVSQPALSRGFSGEEKPDQVPSGFDFLPPSADKPTVSTFVWDLYNSSGFKGVLRGFKIQHWNKNNELHIHEEYFAPFAARGIVYNLKPHTMNFARILAYSGAGDGPVSKVLLISTPEGFAGPIRDLEAFALSQSEIGVLWKKPLEINGIRSGYNITWCRVPNPPTVSNRVIDSTTTNCNSVLLNSSYHHYRLVNLTSSTMYLIQATCLTGAGEGASNSIDIRTLSPLPEDPQMKSFICRFSFFIGVNYPEQPGLRVTGIGAQAINATWIPGRFNPRDPKPIGDTFYVQYRKKGAQFWTRTADSDDTFSVRITTGLQARTEYEIRATSVVKGAFGNNVTRLETSSGILAVNTTKVGAERLQAIVQSNSRSNMIKARSHVLGG